MPAQRRWSLSYQAARFRAFAKRRRSRWVRSLIWSWEFRSGKWNHLEHAVDRPLYDVLVRLLDDGRLLDLGCGNGAVRCELPLGVIARYVGVDISQEAIRRTEQRSSALPSLPGGQLLIAGDIADPEVIERAGGPFDVVLLRETIYYVNVDDVARLLSSAAGVLSERGVIVVQIHDRDRYAGHVERIRESRSVIEQLAPASTPTIILVVR